MYYRALLSIIILTCTAAAARQYFQQISFKTRASASDEAPLQYCDEHVVPESYFVYLQSGYTLIQHSDAIGFAIEPYIDYITLLPDSRLVYGADRIKDELLAAIRADTGVEHVRCNQWVTME